MTQEKEPRPPGKVGAAPELNLDAQSTTPHPQARRSSAKQLVRGWHRRRVHQWLQLTAFSGICPVCAADRCEHCAEELRRISRYLAEGAL